MPSMVVRLIFAALLCAVAMPDISYGEGTAADLPVEVVPNVPGGANSVALSPDERLLASGQYDGTIKLVDMATSRLLRTFGRHAKQVNSVMFMAGGKQLLSAGDDMTIKLWDVETGRLIRTTELKTPIQYFWSIKLSPDGTRALTCTTPNGQYFANVKLWDVATGRLLQTFKSNALRAVFSPDGTRVLAGGSGMNYKPGGQVTLWDAATGRLLRTFEGHKAFTTVWNIDYSPDGQRIVSAAALDKAVRLWDVASGRTLHLLVHEQPIQLLLFSPDGAKVLTSDQEGTFREWSVATGQVLRSFNVKGGISLISFMRDGNRALTRSYDGLQIFDMAAAKPLHTFQGELFFLYAAVYSSDGRSIVSEGNKSLKRWDAGTGQLISEAPQSQDSGYSEIFRPDIDRVLWGKQGSNTLTLTDLSGSQVLATFEHPKRPDHTGLSRDGTRLLTASGNTMMLWDATSGKLLRSFAHPDVGPAGFKSAESVYSVAFSPDGSRVLSGTSSGLVNLWDATSGRLIWTYREGPASAIVWALEFSPDGRSVLAAISDLSPKLIDAATGRLVRAFNGHSSGFLVTVATFSADGTRMMSSSHDLTTKIWDVASGRLLRSLETGTAGSPHFSPDGTRALVNGVVWNLETGERLLSMMSAENEWLAITPEGYFAASAKGAAVLTAVRGLESWSIDQLYQSLYRPDLVREKLAADPRGLVRQAAAQLDLNKVIASGTAPDVRLTLPGRALGAGAIDATSVSAEAEITDRGGGVGRVEWRVNGVTVGIDNPAPGAPGQGGGQPLRLTRSLSLDSGGNAVEVVAYNGANLVASVPARAAVTTQIASPSIVPSQPTLPSAPAPTPVAAARPRLFALVAGVNDYADKRIRLAYAVSDAKEVARGFNEAGGSLYRSVEIKLMTDTEVTRDRLDAAFAAIASQVQPSDVFVLYLAGHGKTVDGHYYFIPQDFAIDGEFTDENINAAVKSRAITQDQLQRWFASIPARKSVILFDTCDSGTLTGDGLETRQLEKGAANDRLAQATGRSIITASGGSQEALEGYHNHGLFTYEILDALNRADGDNNGTIEVAELAAYVYAQVSELSQKVFKQRQAPQMKITANYPFAKQTRILQDDVTPIAAARPTYQVAQAAQLQIQPLPGAPVVRSLSAKTAVTVLESRNGWSLIAADGKPLGYVATRDLAPVQ